MWETGDLLFVSKYGDDEHRQISFAHFTAAEGGLRMPALKVLGWDDRDTALHLDAVAEDLVEHLSWPDDDEDIDGWRRQWRAAFTQRHREVVATAVELSERLAVLAKAIRRRIRATLAIESETGHITMLMRSVQEAMAHDMDADGFADMYAQTVAYGLLSARITDRTDGRNLDIAEHIRTNPLLRGLMEALLPTTQEESGSRAGAIDFDELGLLEIVELLDAANMDAVVRDFGDRNPQEDPVIHFYESFLHHYDPEQRTRRGVFYTPQPVVSYIVRSADALLRSEFGLEDGLADTATWQEMIDRTGDLEMPDGVSPGEDFVRILDPATGTGTFLVEVVDTVQQTLVIKWREQGRGEAAIASLWNEYVRRHLLPRLHGYEIMMAPYAIAHLKLSLKLYETGYRFDTEERAQVYLTNTLEPPHDFTGCLGITIPALARETHAVNTVKKNRRFTVVIGNPPYSGHSVNKRDSAQALIEDYKSGCPELAQAGQAKWLSDDYVKFVSYAQKRIASTGTGIVGFVTNHGYLDNRTFRGMRHNLKETFDKICVLDMHGNAKKGERAPDGSKDENVFDIQQGVAVGVFIRSPQRAGEDVCHADLWGRDDRKCEWLGVNDVAKVGWSRLKSNSPLYLFVPRPRDGDLFMEYSGMWSLPDIFSGLRSSGITTTHDRFAISWTREEAESKIERFLATESEDEARSIWRLCRQGQWNYGRAKRKLATGDWRRRVAPILYRPFDLRITVLDRNVAVLRSESPVMKHMRAGDNLGLITCRQQSQVGVGWQHCGVTKWVIDLCTLSDKTKGNNFIFPVYLRPTNGLPHDRTRREHNLNAEFVSMFASAVEMDFAPQDGAGRVTRFGPEDVFHYLYAVLHSPEYRRRYADFLRSDFPRVPLPGSSRLFVEMARLGARLTAVHLMETDDQELGSTWSNVGVGAGSDRVEKVRYVGPVGSDAGKVWINRHAYCEGVAPEVWDFGIGGYRPAEKWLKDRKGRTLTNGDARHYSKILASLRDTMSLMTDVDEVIGRHGGWPDAFTLNAIGAQRDS